MSAMFVTSRRSKSPMSSSRMPLRLRHGTTFLAPMTYNLSLRSWTLCPKASNDAGSSNALSKSTAP